MPEDYKRRCQKCATPITAEQVIRHPVRSGFSKKHFPLYHYEIVTLCTECAAKTRKVDLFEKGLAYFILGIVIFLLALTLLVLFL